MFTDSVEKKFNKKRPDVDDTVFKAIDQWKDSLRKKFPKLPADRKKTKPKGKKFEVLEKPADDEVNKAKAIEEVSPQDK